jgi:DNA-binding response OmpR family regulator
LEQRSTRILAVDDDADTLALIIDILQDDGYEVYPCSNAEQALRALQRENFGLILADIKLPGMSGVELLTRVREMGLDTEVILMTAYASVATAVEAVRGEAFDYLTKPFALEEFRLRVHEAVQLQASRDRPRSVGYYGDLSIDQAGRRVWIAEREVKLTRLEFDLLSYLFDRPGSTVSREELLRQVWGCKDLDERSIATVKSSVSRLRKKLGDDAHQPRYITNVWGVGYQFGE